MLDAALVRRQAEEKRRKRLERKRSAELADTAPGPDHRQAAASKRAPKGSFAGSEYDRPNRRARNGAAGAVPQAFRRRRIGPVQLARTARSLVRDASPQRKLQSAEIADAAAQSSARMVSPNSSSTVNRRGSSPCLTAKSMMVSSERRLASMPKRSGSRSGTAVLAKNASLASRNTR